MKKEETQQRKLVNNKLVITDSKLVNSKLVITDSKGKHIIQSRLDNNKVQIFILSLYYHNHSRSELARETMMEGRVPVMTHGDTINHAVLCTFTYTEGPKCIYISTQTALLFV